MASIIKHDSIYFEPYLGYYFFAEKAGKICIRYKDVWNYEAPIEKESFRNKSIDYFIFSIARDRFHIDSLITMLGGGKASKTIESNSSIGTIHHVTVDNGFKISYSVTSDSLYFNIDIYLPK